MRRACHMPMLRRSLLPGQYGHVSSCERRFWPVDGDQLVRGSIEQQRDVGVASQPCIARGLVAVVVARLDTGASGHERGDERVISQIRREHERRPTALLLLQVDVGTKPEI